VKNSLVCRNAEVQCLHRMQTTYALSSSAAGGAPGTPHISTTVRPPQIDVDAIFDSTVSIHMTFKESRHEINLYVSCHAGKNTNSGMCRESRLQTMRDLSLLQIIIDSKS
jgi:hypothetical protein